MHLGNGAGVCVPGRNGVGLRGRNRKGAALFPAETLPVGWMSPTSKLGGFLGSGHHSFEDILPGPGWASRSSWLTKWTGPRMSLSAAIQWVPIAPRHNPFVIWVCLLLRLPQLPSAPKFLSL